MMRLGPPSLLSSAPLMLRALLACTFLAACGGGDDAAADSRVAVTGLVDRPALYFPDRLQALPAVTQTVSYSAAGTPQTRTYTGAGLWTLLDTSGLQIDPAVKNDVLRKYVLATGSDGYRAAFSLGEVSPDFGRRGNIVAYAETLDGRSAPLAEDGPLRITAPGDVKGGRYVSMLVRLDVRASASKKTSIGGGASTNFSVSGAVLRPRSFDLAALQALPVVERSVGGNLYRGVSLFDLLNTTVGVATDPAVKNDSLRFYAVATGTDGYQALFALGEIDPGFGAQPDMIAYPMDGAPLYDKGFARIVVPGDGKAGRWVSNLASLEVFAAE